MARFTTPLALVFAFMVLLTVYSESVSSQRSKTRTKVSSVRKKKVATTPGPITTTTLPPGTTTISIEETTNDIPETTIISSQLVSENEESTILPLVSEPLDNIVADDESITSSEDEIITSTKVRNKFLGRSKLLAAANRASSALNYCYDECDKDECTAVDEASCPTGVVLDRCNCCNVCGAGEGNRCNDDTVNLPYNPDIGICGSGLTCKLRSDLEPSDLPEALCECRDQRNVCGSDNTTYSSECKLREAAHFNSSIVVTSWSPCVSAPWIPSEVENVTASLGDEIALSCEVRGYPSPVVHWEFVPIENPTADPTVLPGDDSSVVVVIRGGPDSMMTTSWIQIVGITIQRQGKYVCIGKNSEGVANSQGYVLVSKR